MTRNSRYVGIRNALVSGVSVPVEPSFNSTGKVKDQVVINKFVYFYQDLTFDNSFNATQLVNVPISVIGSNGQKCDEIMDEVDSVMKSYQGLEIVDILESDMDMDLNDNKYYRTDVTYVCIVK